MRKEVEEVSTTVFDVSLALMDRAQQSEMSPLKLQKLSFFAFGWYSHLTGLDLFPETFYAMERGPVVGELLSAHAGRRTVSRDTLLTQLDERDGVQGDLEPFVERVLDAVWDHYGDSSPWELVRLTHEESVWTDAWAARPQGSKRGDLPHKDIIRHFLTLSPPPDLSLPPSVMSFITQDDLMRIEAAPASSSFVAELRAFQDGTVAC